MAKYIIKLKKRHPKNKMQHGRHTIEMVAKEYNLNKEEVVLLKSAGPMYWLDVKTVAEDNKQSEAEQRRVDEERQASLDAQQAHLDEINALDEQINDEAGNDDEGDVKEDPEDA